MHIKYYNISLFNTLLCGVIQCSAWANPKVGHNETEWGKKLCNYIKTQKQFPNISFFFSFPLQLDDSNADSTLHLSAPSPNPYRDLVDKYEALLEVHNAAFNRNRQDDMTTPVSSLHDELTTATTANKNANDNDQQHQQKQNEDDSKLMYATAAAAAAAAHAAAVTGAKRKVHLQTPTDFSEAETSSSGFSDEISNKCTQTEETFLCTIADGEDKFSIYDETSPIDSRFRHCPK